MSGAVKRDGLVFRPWKGLPKGKKKKPSRRRGVIFENVDPGGNERVLRGMKPLLAKKPDRVGDPGGDMIIDGGEDHQQPQLQHFQPLLPDPSSSSIDPFRSLGQPTSPGTDVALHHWTTAFRNTRSPMSPRSEWIRTCFIDPTLIKATIVSSTAHLLNCQNATSVPGTFIRQKNDAIIAINRDLSTPDFTPSDPLIMAVAAMVLIECFNGTPESCTAHIKGLEALVNKRGGIENLGLDGLVKRTVSWADTCAAVVRGQRPVFYPLLDIAVGEDNWPWPLHGPSPRSLHTRLNKLTSSTILSSTLIYIYARLGQLIKFIASTLGSPPQSQALDGSLMSDKFDSVERQIIILLHSSTLSSARDVAVLTAFLNAAYLFVNHCLREIPRSNALGVASAARVGNELRKIDIIPLLSQIPDLIVWTVLVGRMCVMTDGDLKNVFLKAASEIEETLGMSLPATSSPEECFQLADKAVEIVVSREIQDLSTRNN